MNVAAYIKLCYHLQSYDKLTLHIWHHVLTVEVQHCLSTLKVNLCETWQPIRINDFAGFLSCPVTWRLPLDRTKTQISMEENFCSFIVSEHNATLRFKRHIVLWKSKKFYVSRNSWWQLKPFSSIAFMHISYCLSFRTRINVFVCLVERCHVTSLPSFQLHTPKGLFVFKL